MDDLYEEVLQQWNKAKQRCMTFQGRQSLLMEIQQYILNKTDQPFVVYGNSGEQAHNENHGIDLIKELAL